ncbi:MAG: ATP-binding cassette domain-containing protein [Actinomycetota bacterium]|nr:ATP-binding cassette domain-containing protein [Actinomycetota bacterium]
MKHSDTPLVSIRDLTITRDGRQTLHVDSLDLHRGEHIAILGPNGSGKSTLFSTIVRDLRPLWREGEPSMLLLGRERWELQEARSLFGIVSNDMQERCERKVTVRDTVLSGFFGSVGIRRHHAVTDAMHVRAAELEGLLGIEHLSSRTMDTLSTGEGRRALIARALAPSPEAIILDEPCDGLDPNARHHFIGAVRRIAQTGHTLLMVTHHIADIIPEIDRVITLRDGGIVADGPKSQILTEERLSELFAIEARVSQRDGFTHLW